MDADPGDYVLCWSADPAQGFLTRVAYLQVQGPRTGQQKACHIGRVCVLDSVTCDRVRGGLPVLQLQGTANRAAVSEANML